MAVYERNYGRYKGPLTPEGTRFLILPRYAFREVFQSKFFTAFFTLCFALPFAGLLAIYLHHNISILKFPLLQELAKSMPINANFFRTGLDSQSWLCLLLALTVAPALIAPDLRNNGLPLYLARPFTRTEYVAGKMAVLVVLMSLITWIPGLLLFFFQAYLEGAGWLGQNLRIGTAIFIGSWVWILVLSLVSLAVSAWVKWKPVARVTLLIVFFIFTAFGKAMNEMLNTSWGWLVSMWVAVQNVLASLFDQPIDSELQMPVWAAWLTLVVAISLCLWLLSRRIRAYEVVR